VSNFINSIPISKKYINRVLDLVSTRENISLLVANGTGISSFGLSLQSKTSGIKQYIYAKLGKDIPIFVYLDLQLHSKFIEKHIFTILGQYSAQSSVGNQILEIIEKGKDLYFFIDNYSPELKEGFDEVLYYQTLGSKHIKYMFVVKYAQYIPEKLETLKLYHNTVKFSFLDELKSMEWLKIVAEEMNIEIDNEELHIVYQYCGGIPILLKNALRIYREVNSVQDIFTNKKFKSLLKKYIAKFNDEERKVLYSIVWSLPVSGHDRVIEYLQSLKILDDNYQVEFAWLRDIFIDDKPTLSLTKDGLISERVDLLKILTEKENNFLKLFNSNDEHLITRDNVIQFLWGDNYPDKYSDWALDQFISRLRKKLKKAGFGSNVIKTVRKKGYQLVLA